EVVGRRAVAAQNDHIVELAVGDDDAALHPVLDDGFALARRLDAHGGADAGRRLPGIAITPGALDGLWAPGRTLLLPGQLALGDNGLVHGRELGRGQVAAIGPAGVQHLRGHLAMPVGACKLIERLAVPIELEPAQTVEDRLDRRLGRALAVGVLDA